jgi:hypothetical protein
VLFSEIESRAGCRTRDEITDFLLTLTTDELYKLLVHYSEKYDEGFLLDFHEHILREYPTDEEAHNKAFWKMADMRYEECREASV